MATSEYLRKSSKENRRKKKESQASEFTAEVIGAVESYRETLRSRVGTKLETAARVLMLLTALCVNEGCALVKGAMGTRPDKQDMAKIHKDPFSDHVTKEVRDISEITVREISTTDFLELHENEQKDYVSRIARMPEFTRQIRVDGAISVEVMQEAGPRIIAQLHRDLTDLSELYFDGPDEGKEHLFATTSVVQHFMLEYTLNWNGDQSVTRYGTQGESDIAHLVQNQHDHQSPYNKNEADTLLEDGKEGEQLQALMEEVLAVKGSELSRIKQIYDLVASHVPFYKMMYHRNDRHANERPSFEEILSKKAGVCGEKNSLLAYSLRKAGIEAYSWHAGGHLWVRVLSSEGVLETDVTSSEAFAISQPSSNPVYGFDWTGLDGAPPVLPKGGTAFPNHRGDDSYSVTITLDNPEAIAFVAHEFGDDPKEIETVVNAIKPKQIHPLYSITNGKPITPETAGRYTNDLFPKVLQPKL